MQNRLLLTAQYFSGKDDVVSEGDTPDLSSTQVALYPETTSAYFDTGYGDIINLPGHLFTIPGKEMLNINVVYMKFEEDRSTGESVPVPIGESLSV